jgi:hypothetical protein
VKRLLALLAGGLGLRAFLRRRREPALGSSPAAGLRAKLDEARAVAPEPEPEPEPQPEPEAQAEPEAQPVVDAAPSDAAPLPEPEPDARPGGAGGGDEDARRADVHARARQAIEDLGEPQAKDDG